MIHEIVRLEPGRRSALSGVLLAIVLVGSRAVAAPIDAPAGAAQALTPAPAAAPAQVERVRYEADRGSTRVIVHLSRAVPYEVRVLGGESARGSERRLVIDFSNARLGQGASHAIGVEDGLLKQIRTGQFTARTARVVLDLASVTGHSVTALDQPPRVVIDIAGRPASEPVADRSAPETRAAGERAPGERAGGERAEAARAPEAGPPVVAAAPPAPGPPSTSGLPEARRGGEPANANGAKETSEAASTAPVERAPPAQPQSVEPSAPPGGTDKNAAATEQTARAGEPQDSQSQLPAARSGDLPGASRLPSRTTPWVIVLDPGHGGTDPGTHGVDGVFEKDVTLAIAKRLKRRLEEGLRARVLLTRSVDRSRSLAERTAFANANSADLFVSIHTNADAAGELHGIETYTLNNSDERATMRLAKMENGPGVRTGRGDLSYILSDMVQSGKEEESILLAHRLHMRLLERLRARYTGVRNLGVKKGPFYVLVGAYMPCVLVETSFLSHPIEGRRLISGAYQDQIAEGLFLGVMDFLGDARLAKTL